MYRRKLSYVFITTFLIICIMSMASEANIITDKLLDGVEDAISKETKKIEDKIDEFVIKEVKKVEQRLIILYIAMILISMAYSTILIFLAHKYLNKGEKQSARTE